jgi:hypothetical protein
MRSPQSGALTSLTLNAWLCLAALGMTASCIGPRVTYRLHGIVTTPLGWKVTDSSRGFGEIFCATLTHLDPQQTDWGQCQQYLDATVSEQPAAQADISREWRVLIVGGIFSKCFEDRNLILFEQAKAHLEQVHHITTVILPVGSADTPEQNAAVIADYLSRNPGKYIAVGHSKGAVDLMMAVQKYDAAQKNIRALVSVAGAIGGSRLIDFGDRAVIDGFEVAVASSGLGRCRIDDHGGVNSMRRSVRNEFLRQWSPPASLRSYSVVGVTDKDHVSKPLQLMWKLQTLYSLDQDSQMIAEEAVIPGAQFLGVAKADHWALALPFSEYPDAKVRRKMEHNKFPRVALLEAIVRYIDTGH